MIDQVTQAPVAVRVDTVARMLDTAPSTVLYWIKTGRLPATKVGRSWRIRIEDVRVIAGETMSTVA